MGKLSSLRKSKQKLLNSVRTKRWQKYVASSTQYDGRPTNSQYVQPSQQASQITVSDENIANVPKRIKLQEDHQNIHHDDQAPDYMILSLQSLQNLIGVTACKICGNQSLNISVRNTFGFALQLSVACSECDFEHTTYNSEWCKEKSKRRTFDVNIRMVKAISSIGKGYAALERFCIALNMKPMAHTSYDSILLKVQRGTETSTQELLVKARQEVKKAHIEVNPLLEETTVIDIAVSYDGSWHKRGHSSAYMVGCVVDILTGFVIDYEVLSKHCQWCSINSREYDDDDPEFYFIKEGHQCEANYSGTSQGMEMTAALTLWRRSEKQGFRYTTLLSDGDAKTFTCLQENKVYGDVVIEKEECINHVAKRMGTALRNIATKERLGGKSPGALTVDKIDRITKYYRGAICDNVGDRDKMKRSIYAILDHCRSTDQVPRHAKCPVGTSDPAGKRNWCFYNRAIAEGRKPESHTKKTMKTALSEKVVTKIIPVFQRLAADLLLDRCLLGRTQNANECLHHMIWEHCPKTTFVTKRRITLAVCMAVSQYNFGCAITELSKQDHLGISLGRKSIALAKVQDVRTKHRRLKQRIVAYNMYRKKVKQAKLLAEQRRKKEEGETYGPGQF